MIKIPHIKTITDNMEVLHKGKMPDDPQVVLIHNFIPDEEIERILKAGRDLEVYEAITLYSDGSKGVDKSFRSCTQRIMKREHSKWMMDRFQSLTGWEHDDMEEFHLIQYMEGDFVNDHFDYSDGTKRKRAGTFVTYLREPLAGGYTTFPELGLKIKPEKGASLFMNYLHNKTPKSIHASTPVLAGDKWIITSFMLEVEHGK